jgi:hypothetical protein
VKSQSLKNKIIPEDYCLVGCDAVYLVVINISEEPTASIFRVEEIVYMWWLIYDAVSC